MFWKRVARSLRPPVKTLEAASWLRTICWLVPLVIGLWLLSWLEPHVAKQTFRQRPMSVFEITALLTMVAAAFLGSNFLGLLNGLQGNAPRFCRAIAGFAASLPVGVYVTKRLGEIGLEYNYGPAIVGAVFCGLAAVFLYPDPFAKHQCKEESSTQKRD